jgi:hypothetical protein
MDKGGAPTKYKSVYNKQAYKLCLLGATDDELADFFEVHRDTIYEWKKVYPRFSDSIKKAKLVADATIAESLYERALGCTINVQQAIKLTTKMPVLDDNGKPTRQMMQTEVIQIVDLKQGVAPDTTAAIFWLKNRNPANWKDKQVHTLEGDLNLSILNIDPLSDIDDPDNDRTT